MGGSKVKTAAAGLLVGRQDTGKELSLKNYLAVHAIEPERLLSDRTWTQWKAAAGICRPPTDQDIAILSPAIARACQVTAPGYLGAIKGLPASGLGLVGEDAAAANMLYSLLWEKKGAQRGLGTREEAFRRLEANPSILADLREVADYQMDVTQCAGHKPYPLPLELHGNYTNNEIQAAFGGVALGTFPRPRCTGTTRLI